MATTEATSRNPARIPPSVSPPPLPSFSPSPSLSPPLAMQKVTELTILAAHRKDPPLVWAVETARALHDAGIDFPSVHLGSALVNLACPSSSSSVWPYIQQAMSSQLVSSLHLLALLTTRALPNRVQSPEVYSKFIEISSNHVFSLGCTKLLPHCDRIIQAVDEALQISASYGVPVTDLGMAVVHFVFILAFKLLDATCEDWGISSSHFDKRGKVGGLTMQSYHNQATEVVNMEIEEQMDNKGNREHEELGKKNSLAAIGLVTKLLQNKKTSGLIRLAWRYLPEQWSTFIQRIELLESFALSASPLLSKPDFEALRQLIGCLQQAMQKEWIRSKHPTVETLFDMKSLNRSYGNILGVGCAAGWLPLDIFMEDAMDGRRVPRTSTAELLADLVKSLQAVSNASWHAAFLALWIAALRLVQREHETMEGPRPNIEARLSMLLSIVPLVCALLIDEEEKQGMETGLQNSTSVGAGEKKEKRVYVRRAALISSLQILGQFEGLLSAPQFVVAAAQQAASVAITFITCERGVSGGGCETLLPNDGNLGDKTAGNMRHLIVETCIARSLLDKSAYRWPGYVGNSLRTSSHCVSSSGSPWSAFMDGAPLLGPLKMPLTNTPAGSLLELEKIYNIATNGLEEERVAAAGILCGGSLIRGWNIQEHVVRLVVRLLSHSISGENKGASNPLVSCALTLGALLNGITSADAVHVFSLHGMLPELAATLMPICEVFGSVSPAMPLKSSSGEDVSVLNLFSLAFLLLIRLWKFHHPPVEHRLLGSQAPLGSDLSLEYLLLLRNMQTQSWKTSAMPATSNQSAFGQVTLDSFPKLKAWYLQHEACIASTLSGLVRGDVHQVVDRLLTMFMRKCGKAQSGSISTNTIGGDDAGARPLLPAWDLLAAVPFVVDAVLTACGHGKLAPRDLTTGLKDLVDFFPASFATIVSYFAAEITRGLWKPAPMNGKDWPSPGANLYLVEAEIKDMLAATGVSFPSLVPAGSILGNAPATLPLPLAALVSLTITYKVEKSADAVLGLGGPALESAAGDSPWPSLPIVAALWAQKVRKWQDYFVFSSAHTVLKQDKDAVTQLLGSCFSVTLGLANTSVSKLTVHGGVGALLGHGTWSHAGPNGRHPVAPGVLYLHVCPTLHDIMFLSGEILFLVVKTTRELCSTGGGIDAESSSSTPSSSKQVSRLRYAQPSLAAMVARLMQASLLGASLLSMSGGTTLVQLLYTETLPSWFLSAAGGKAKNKASVPGGTKRGCSSLLEGFGLAYFAVLSGALVWGVSRIKDSGCNSVLVSRRKRAVSTHMEFIARVLDGAISFNCHRTTWKAYALGFISLVVSFASDWILDVKVDTLRKISRGLRAWHENDLAIALLESGGPDAMSAAAESILGF